jgi:glutathione S-transferase
MAPNYKFYYFDWTGLGEISRLIFAISDVKYEDVRVPIDDHFPILAPEWKEKMPWGQVPLLEVDGKKLAQASAINRYLARQYNLAGANDFEAAKCDEFVDAIKDYTTEWQALFRERDPAKQAEIKKNILEVATPKYFNKFNKAIEENNGAGLVGDRLTWADIYLAHLGTYFEQFAFVEYIKDYPAVDAMVQRFFARPDVKKFKASSPKMMKFDINVFNDKMAAMMKK